MRGLKLESYAEPFLSLIHILLAILLQSHRIAER